MKKIKSQFKGITLIEVLVVLVILSLLIFGSYFAVFTYFKRARDAKRKRDLEIIKIALYDYSFDDNCFPKTLPACGTDFGVGSQVYLDNFPCDYKDKAYTYQTDGSDCSQWFKILTNLEDTKDKNIDKIGCRSGCGQECNYNYGLSSPNVRLNENCPIITPTIAPTAPVTPVVPPVLYACTPSGRCEEFIDPVLSRCPIVFENDPTCEDLCGDHDNRCHDERGKKN